MRAKSSADHQLRNLPEVTVGPAEHEVVLDGEGRDPEVVRRYRASVVAKLPVQLPVVARRLVVGQEYGHPLPRLYVDALELGDHAVLGLPASSARQLSQG